jgi:hypothetical protein
MRVVYYTAVIKHQVVCLAHTRSVTISSLSKDVTTTYFLVVYASLVHTTQVFTGLA